MIKYLLLTFQALRRLFHVEGAKVFKRLQFQGRLKEINLEQNPVRNTFGKFPGEVSIL